MRILPLVLLFFAVPIMAAERKMSVSSFDRIRVDAPVSVRIATGASPSAVVTGDRDAMEAIDIRQNGTGLTIRRSLDRWQERPAVTSGTPLVVTLATGTLSGVMVTGAADVRIDRMRAQRVDLSVSGAGKIAVISVEADQANATVIGSGAIAIAGGRTRAARLLGNGSGAIDASGLDAGDLAIRLDGPGDIHARARLTASVDSAGTGSIAIAGDPKCQVRATGPVACGSGR